jgi:hypothetical protein
MLIDIFIANKQKNWRQNLTTTKSFYRFYCDTGVPPFATNSSLCLNECKQVSPLLLNTFAKNGGKNISNPRAKSGGKNISNSRES